MSDDPSDATLIRHILVRYHGHMESLDFSDPAVRSQLALDLGFLTGFAIRSLADSDHADLRRVADGARHLLQSLLAVRDGVPDSLLRKMVEVLDVEVRKARR